MDEFSEEEVSAGSSDAQYQENVRTLGKMIKGMKVAMMTTFDPGGILRSRPMATLDLDFDGSLWFFTGADSGKVHSIMNDQHVNLAYVSLEDNRFVSVSGAANLVRDREKIEQYWRPTLRAWFPQGLNDPELALIRVDADSAEYWDSPSSAWVQLVGFTKAILTGRPYDASEHHGRVSIRSGHPDLM